MRRMTIVEANEVPLSVFRWYGESHPGSTIASLLESAAIGETIVTETLTKELYPSQTWASLASGVPFEKHGVYWYGDPKPDEFPLYWQSAARAGRSVGTVGVLHSSPISAEMQDRLSFCLPDAFASDPTTLPASLEPLQEFNLYMTKANGRAVASTAPLAAYSRGALGAVKARLSPATWLGLGRLAGEVASGRIPKERLRTAQFLLMADPFLRLTSKNDPDLAVFFTNHVAAAMHRYWFASFPDDWEEALFDDAWVNRFAGELPAALDALDRFLGDVLNHCLKSNRALLVMSSMGQTGGAPLVSDGDYAVTLVDERRFAEFLGIQGSFEVRNSMVPHLSLAFDGPEAAADAKAKVRENDPATEWMELDVSGNVLTISYDLRSSGNDLVTAGTETVPAATIGASVVSVEEHRCGTHHPLGTLMAANTTSEGLDGTTVEALQVAPAILQALGVKPLPHHQDPEFSL